jgi:putative acetyltransferase
VRIVVDDLSGSQISEFLDEHVQQMRSITPVESKHALDLDSLRQPEITFWSVTAATPPCTTNASPLMALASSADPSRLADSRRGGGCAGRRSGAFLAQGSDTRAAGRRPR